MGEARLRLTSPYKLSNSGLKSSYKVARALGISQSAAIRKIRKYVFQDASDAASRAGRKVARTPPLSSPNPGRDAGQ
ncbi:MAG: hypothetical protein H5U04_07530 [Firmicutes bacterium]|nr:hypothetical protein [Bacillota bacterium]